MTNFFLLDAHSHGSGLHEAVAHFLEERLGDAGRFIDEVLFHGLYDTVILLPFLFLTYLALEFIEHRATDKAQRLMRAAGPVGPLVGGVLGAVPQCGFSAVAANFYTGRLISLGTLIAVFISTSDEMLPILIAGNVELGAILSIVIYKAAVGIAVGFVINLVLRLLGRAKREADISGMCEGGCNCERGILRSAVYHTLEVSLYILAVTLLINLLIFFIGEDSLAEIMVSIPFVSHLISAFVGLIPNCAVSVALTRLAVGGIISHGTMLSGLISGSGVGLLVLFRTNKRRGENLLILLILALSGVVFGIIADLIPFMSVL